MCVLNRTGRSRLLACRTCRELARCERCGATVAERDEQLVCPVCDTARPVVCLHCTATRFRAVKPGVARVRDDLAALLPRVEVESVEASSSGDPVAPVLIGTEAVLHRLGGADGDAPLWVSWRSSSSTRNCWRPGYVPPSKPCGWWCAGPRARSPPGARGGHAAAPDPAARSRGGAGGRRRAIRSPLTRAERDRRRAPRVPTVRRVWPCSAGTPGRSTRACSALRAAGVTVLGPVDAGRRALRAGAHLGRARRRARGPGDRRRARARPTPGRRRPSLATPDQRRDRPPVRLW